MKTTDHRPWRNATEDHRKHPLLSPPARIAPSLWIALWFAILAGGVALGETPIGWRTNLTAGLAESQSRGQPVLLYFTATWCGPCQLMARTTFKDEQVTNELASVVAVALDLDENRELAAQRGVTAVPYFEMLTPAGETVTQVTGYQRPEAFIQWITNSVDRVQTMAVRQKELETKLTAARWILTKEPSSAAKAVGWLLDLSVERESDVQRSALKELGRLAATNPILVLNGLNHPRLAARIQAANLLRSRLGGAFDVDPWEDAESRRKAVADWRTKLESTPLK